MSTKNTYLAASSSSSRALHQKGVGLIFFFLLCFFKWVPMADMLNFTVSKQVSSCSLHWFDIIGQSTLLMFLLAILSVHLPLLCVHMVGIVKQSCSYLPFGSCGGWQMTGEIEGTKQKKGRARVLHLSAFCFCKHVYITIMTLQYMYRLIHHCHLVSKDLIHSSRELQMPWNSNIVIISLMLTKIKLKQLLKSMYASFKQCSNITSICSLASQATPSFSMLHATLKSWEWPGLRGYSICTSESKRPPD